MEGWWLTLTVLLPAIGAVLLLFVREDDEDLDTTESPDMGRVRLLSLLVMTVTLLLGAKLWTDFDPARTTASPEPGATEQFWQFSEQASWMDFTLGDAHVQVDWSVGLDGINILLVMLTCVLGPILVLAGRNSIRHRVKEFHISLLLLQAAMIGCFVARNLVLFYVFWELMLIPMYLIIGVWGGEKRIYAAVKFFLFTAVGSLLMLVAILHLGSLELAAQRAAIGGVGPWPVSFDYDTLIALVPGQITPAAAGWCFLAFALAFAIKVPMVPFHTWLPHAHVQAPTVGSVVLAGVLLKMGTYGFLRLALPLFPEAVEAYAPAFMTLAVIGIIYGALLAWAQFDLKKLVAYSSVSHLGFVMLGLFALNMQGMEGALYQMVNHGISTGALFLLVGVLYERRHTRLISEFGGLAKVMPVFAVMLVLFTLSSVGLPGTNGFVGEFLILLGAFGTSKTAAVLGATGVVLGAVYMLNMVQKVLFGPVDREENEDLPDTNAFELACLVPLAVLVIVMGLWPNLFLSRVHNDMERYQGYATREVVEPGPVGELHSPPAVPAAESRDVGEDDR